MSNIINTLPKFMVRDRPYSNIRPLTYSDGMTVLEKIESLHHYLCHLVESVNTSLDEFGRDILDELVDTVEYVNTVIDQVINNSIEINDAVVAELLADTNSLTRAALDAITDAYMIDRPVEHLTELFTTDAFRGAAGTQPGGTDNAYGGPTEPYESWRESNGFVLSGNGSLVANPNSGLSNFIGVDVPGYTGTRIQVVRGGLPVSGSFYVYINRPDLDDTTGTRIRFHSGGATVQHVRGSGSVTTLHNFDPASNVCMQIIDQHLTVWNNRRVEFQYNMQLQGLGVTAGYAGFARDAVAPVGMRVSMMSVTRVY